MRDARRGLSTNAAILVAALAVATFAAPSGSLAQAPATPVVMKPAGSMTLTDSVDAIGTIHAGRDATLRPEVSDRLVKINVKDGAKVAKGDLLFQLDDTVEQAQLKSAKLTRDVKRAALERMEQLIKRQVAAAAKLPETRAEAVLALVDVEKAQIAVNQTQIRAPFDGVLGAVDVEEADYVSPGQTLATIYEMEPLEVRFRLPQRQLSRLAVGQTVNVSSSGAQDHRHPGKITFINPALDSTSKSVEVKAVLEPADDLRPGMFVSVSVAIETIEQAVVVPDEALLPTSSGFVLFVVSDGKAKLTPVEVGLRSGEKVQIAKGVSAGSLVVVEGQMKLRDGASVVDAAATAAAAPAKSDAK